MPDWSKTAFVFPGQGSQIVGMGQDFAQVWPQAAETFAQADEILGFALSQICFNGPADLLDSTVHTQPAIYVCSMAILRVLQVALPEARPGFAAGHSLGEFTALTAAGALRFEEGIRLVYERGRLMAEAGEQQPGAMAALLGIEREVVEQVCEDASKEAGQPVVLANDNCPGQLVISGDSAALDIAMSLAAARGAKRSVRLAVSIAAHSPLMESASAQFRRLLDDTPFTEPQLPVYSNATAAPLASVEAIRNALNGQLTSPVRWTESMQAMIAAGAGRFVEIGPGDVLSGLVKRLDRALPRATLNSVEAFDAFVASVS